MISCIEAPKHPENVDLAFLSLNLLLAVVSSNDIPRHSPLPFLAV